MMKRLKRLKRLFQMPAPIVLASLAIFGVSLTQKALTYSDFNGQGKYSSLALFLTGGISILGGGLFEWLVWLANPLYFVSIFLLLKRKKQSMKTSILATVVAFAFLFWKNILVSENGRNAEIVALKLGYWLWLSSILVLTIGAIVYFGNVNDSKQSENKVPAG